MLHRCRYRCGKRMHIIMNVLGTYLLLLLVSFLTVESQGTFLLHYSSSIVLATIPPSRTSSSSTKPNYVNTTTVSNSSNNSSNYENDDSTKQHYSYAHARNIRVLNGHNAAVPIYQTLLSSSQKRNYDYTAASRIAAAPNSPWRHDQACPCPSLPSKNSNNTNEKNIENRKVEQAIEKLRNLLCMSNYNNQNIQRLFGISSSLNKINNMENNNHGEVHVLSYANSPIYLKPQSAGSQFKLPTLLDDLGCCDDDGDDDGNIDQNKSEQDSSLKCLISLFLLGFAVPKELLVKYLIGGEDSISTLEYLGFLYPCEVDSSIMVPYVHIFPIDVDIILEKRHDNNNNHNACKDNRRIKECTEKTSILIVTDVHPKILSRTTVGKEEDGAVMYIGPDSLALVQCLPLQSHIHSLPVQEETQAKNFRILDICAGSGIQGTSALVSLNLVRPSSTVTFVDVNERALRFARFNALLNGIETERIFTIKTDITASKEDIVKGSDYYDIILANPPFIPAPASSLIQKRYGLFSLGGLKGDDVLSSIISSSPLLLRPGSGFLGIVSEFMNPPQQQEMDEQNVLHDIKKWWNDSKSNNGDAKEEKKGGKGILFTNQFPITSSTYSARRADDEFEFNLWLDHLQACNIHSISPGLFFMTLVTRNTDYIFHGYQVPKSDLGSLWTPFNVKAVQYVKRRWTDMIQEKE